MPAKKKGPQADARGVAELRARLDEQGGEALYLLVGDDRQGVDQALALLEERLVDPDLAALNAAKLRGSETTVQEVVGLCSTLPMMSERRLLILREPERLKGDDELGEYLGNPCPSTSLVLVPSEHDRRRKLAQTLEKACTTVVFDAPGPGDLQAWVKRSLAPHGIEVSPEALGLLQDLVETDTLLLANELEKLALYCTQTRRVEREDVEAVLGRTRAVEVWALTGAIEDGRPELAVAALRRLLGQGAAVPMLVGTLDWCLGRLVASEPPKAPPGRRRALDARRHALKGRSGEIYGLLRRADRAVRRAGDSPETWLERAILAASS
jgi:DNA polymerase-3 subunit delta